MRPFNSRSLFLLMFISCSVHSFGQYTIAANEAWSATGAPAFCNGCTFTISSGVTFTLDVNSVTCVNCLFSGGIVVDNAKFSWQGGTFANDSVAFDNSSSSLQVSGVGGPLFNNDKVEFTQPITCQGCTFNGDAIHIDLPAATSEVTFQSSGSFTTTTVNSSTVTVNTGEWYANSTTNVTSSVMTFNNSSSINNNTGTFTLSKSQLNLNGNSYVATSTGFTIENNSWVTVGDGTGTSGAYFFDNSGTNLAIKDNSGMGIAGQNNYYSNWGQYSYTSSSGTLTNFTTTGLDLNCGAAYSHTTAYCNSNSQYVFGCATLNSGGPVACVTLALSGVTLTAELAGNNVDLSWTDPQAGTASGYLVQRSNGNDNWITITTVAADASGPDEYHFEDLTAPAGTVSYRIARTDHDGNIVYSTISAVTISHARNTISLFPNPASGHTFYVTVPGTSQLVLNVYTLTGQLIMRTTLQGQTQYPVQLPSQLLSGATVIVQAILPDQTASFPLLLR
jgi:hypothetical protein